MPATNQQRFNLTFQLTALILFSQFIALNASQTIQENGNNTNLTNPILPHQFQAFSPWKTAIPQTTFFLLAGFFLTIIQRLYSSGGLWGHQTVQFNEKNIKICSGNILKEVINQKKLDLCINKISNLKERETLKFYRLVLEKLKSPVCISTIEDLNEGVILCKKSSKKGSDDFYIEIFDSLGTLNESIKTTKGRFPSNMGSTVKHKDSIYVFKIHDVYELNDSNEETFSYRAINCALLSELSDQSKEIIDKFENPQKRFSFHSQPKIDKKNAPFDENVIDTRNTVKNILTHRHAS